MGLKNWKFSDILDNLFSISMLLSIPTIILGGVLLLNDKSTAAAIVYTINMTIMVVGAFTETRAFERGF